MIAMIAGTALALLALGYVLYPLLVGTSPRGTGSSAIICPTCGSRAEADASFCSHCGGPLVVP